jgi:hypothetical protein
MRKASSAVQRCPPMMMPLACSMTARECRAVLIRRAVSAAAWYKAALATATAAFRVRLLRPGVRGAERGSAAGRRQHLDGDFLLDNGVLASYQQCHFTPDYRRNDTVIGTRGRLGSFGDGPGATIKLWNTRSDTCGAEADEVILVPLAEGGPSGADPVLVAEFLRFAQFGGPTLTAPVAGRSAVAVGVAAPSSLRSGGEVVTIRPLRPEMEAYFEAPRPASTPAAEHALVWSCCWTGDSTACAHQAAYFQAHPEANDTSTIRQCVPFREKCRRGSDDYGSGLDRLTLRVPPFHSSSHGVKTSRSTRP